MRVTRFFRTRLASQKLNQRRLAIHQEVESGKDGVQVVERIEAVCARAEFAGRLRAAEQQDTDQGDFVPVEVEDVGEAMLEFDDAAVGGGGAREPLIG